MSEPQGESKNKEVILEGVPASPGIIIGPAYLHAEASWKPGPVVITPSEVINQINIFQKSVQKTYKHLKQSYHNTYKYYGQELAEILGIQIAFLEDKIFLKEFENTIEKNCYDAAYATFVVFQKKKEYFLQMSNEYFRDRAFDIQSLSEMILKNILGKSMGSKVLLNYPSIVIAENLSPSDTVQLHEQKVLGFATNTGGKTSHTAIVARSLGVPAVVGLKKITDMVKVDDQLVLDGNTGKVIINPTPQTITAYKEQRRLSLKHEKYLIKESSLLTQTKDGKRIFLFANMEFEEEVRHLLQVGADGIGLFRTEGVFLSRQDLPSEDEQAQIYGRIAEKMYPRQVVIRTLDIGGDKMFAGLKNLKEENPFLGWRAIRFWLDHKTGFLGQIKAILRANQKGNVKILLPMISGLGEINQVRNLLEEARDLLRKEKIEFREKIDLGIMVEIPSVVVLADIFAQKVDFFSIGTNDLVQYTLAVDRGNEKVADLYSHFHPAVIRMVQMTVDAGRKAKIPVGMCGEMAGDPLAVPLLLAMGFENLSASHAIIPGIKKVIRELTLGECQNFYKRVQNFSTTQEVIKEAKDFFKNKFSDSCN